MNDFFNSWRQNKIGDLPISLIDGDRSGKYPKRSEFQNDGALFLNAESISNGSLDISKVNYISLEKYLEITKGRLQTNDLILTMRGNGVGDIALYTKKNTAALINAQMLILRPDNNEIDSQFLYYKFIDPISKRELMNFVTGSAQPQLTITHLKHFPVILPPLSKQKAIAHILGSLDDKIELNRQMNATLEGMAQALFKSWFVDFDPVIDNALAAGNPIPEAFAARAETRRKALADETANRDVAKQFPAAFQFTEEMGWIPEGWDVGVISDLCLKIQNGGTPKRDNDDFWKDGKIPWLTSGEVRQSMITATQSAITEYGLKMSSAKWLPSYSTVVALYGATAGQVAFISCEMSTNQAVCGLVPKKHFRYFNYLLIARKVQYFENQARGSAQQNISKGIIETTDTILPTINSIQFCEKQVQPIFEKWIQNIQINKQLSNLRDTLLPKLISGEIRIPEAEKITEEALA